MRKERRAGGSGQKTREAPTLSICSMTVRSFELLVNKLAVLHNSLDLSGEGNYAHEASALLKTWFRKRKPLEASSSGDTDLSAQSFPGALFSWGE